MELWDLYDRDRLPLGRTMVRGEAQAPGEYHIVVHICMFNSLGEMLLQQRQTFKDGWPGMWDITLGGSAIAGESSREGAARELREELGIAHDFSQARPALTINFARGFDDFYLIDGEADVQALRLQPEEVRAAKWGTREEILRMIDEGVFIPYHRQFIDFLFALHASGSMLFSEDGAAGKR